MCLFVALRSVGSHNPGPTNSKKGIFFLLDVSNADLIFHYHCCASLGPGNNIVSEMFMLFVNIFNCVFNCLIMMSSSMDSPTGMWVEGVMEPYK